MREKAIGVFDSGLGGLTVVNEIRNLLPNENIIYFGDTARVPYGNKSPKTIRAYSEENVRFLLSQGVKVIVVACNSATSTALDFLKNTFKEIPVLGVISPIVDELKREPVPGPVGVIGTRATINSNVYQTEISNALNVEVLGVPCPLFVPIAEEGLFDRSFTLSIVEEYLFPLKEKKISTLVLGCTHYPILKRIIDFYFEGQVKLLDSAYYTARELKKVLIDNELRSFAKTKGSVSYFVSDNLEGFESVASRFISDSFENLNLVKN